MGAHLIFFLSGAAALIYQVVWQRLLVFFSGADVYSITVIVAAFMGGLGLGSFAGGRMADRLGAARSLRAFAAAEVGIGLFGLLSKSIYYDGLYGRLPHLAVSPAIAAAVLLASLLLPTFLMGVSLPLLARALTTNLSASGRVIGSLYGWNTLGAATGALLGTWVLLPRLGLDGSLWLAAAINGACAAGAMWLGRRPAVIAAPSVEASEFGAREVPSASLPFGWWLAIYGTTGFIALGLEIVWFRLLSVLLKSTAFTFGTLLAVYLTGLGVGAVVAARRISTSHRPGAMFLALQYALTIYTAVSIVALIAMLSAGWPQWLSTYVAEYEPFPASQALEALRSVFGGGPGPAVSLPRFFALYFLLPALLMGPPTLLMGLSFPYLQRAVQSDLPRLGRRLGTLLAVNIGGAVLGAMITGWVLLPNLGTAGTLRMLVALGVLFALPVGALAWPNRRPLQLAVMMAATAVTGLSVMLMPRAEILWARLHGVEPSLMLVGEDGAGVSLLKTDAPSFRGRIGVFVNGLGQSWLPYGGIHTALGLLPVLIHPAPSDVVVIGLGSGDTVFGAAARNAVQRLVVVEIIGAQRETLQRLFARAPYAGLASVLEDPRIEHRVGDGRAFLLQSSQLFDVIEADALRPTSAYAGNLYSREYFELLSRHLKPGGLAVTWAPTDRIRRTFLSVFPHVLALGDIYVGSHAAIPYDRASVFARVDALKAHFAAAGIDDVMQMLAPHLDATAAVFGPDVERRRDSLNQDLFPRDEFARPQ